MKIAEPIVMKHLLCMACVAECRVQPLDYHVRASWFVCPIHGPQLTAEYLYAATRVILS